MNVLVTFGTRPEAIKLFPVIHALRDDPSFNVTVCVTAQHREILDQVLSVAEIDPDVVRKQRFNLRKHEKCKTLARHYFIRPPPRSSCNRADFQLPLHFSLLYGRSTVSERRPRVLR